MKQYHKFFEFDGVELEFSDDALEAVAEQALLRGTGARGLRAILEEVLLNVMYDLPSRTDIGKCLIDRRCVLEKVNPTLVPRTEVGPPGAPHHAAASSRTGNVLPAPVTVGSAHADDLEGRASSGGVVGAVVVAAKSMQSDEPNDVVASKVARGAGGAAVGRRRARVGCSTARRRGQGGPRRARRGGCRRRLTAAGLLERPRSRPPSWPGPHVERAPLNAHARRRTAPQRRPGRSSSTPAAHGAAHEPSGRPARRRRSQAAAGRAGRAHRAPTVVLVPSERTRPTVGQRAA